MLTVETVLDALRKFDIQFTDLVTWEEALGLNIPVNTMGQKLYSPHHINLFKNVRKNLALGRSLEQIRSILALPEAEEAQVLQPIDYTQTRHRLENTFLEVGNQQTAVGLLDLESSSDSFSEPLPEPFYNHQQDTAATKTPLPGASLAAAYGDLKPFMTPPTSLHQDFTTEIPALGGVQQIKSTKIQQMASQAATQSPLSSASSSDSSTASIQAMPIQAAPTGQLFQLMEKLLSEKDQLQKRLMDTERLNSHLYNANEIFNAKVKELAAQIHELKVNSKEEEALKLLNDKAQLHKQLLDTERAAQNLSKQVLELQHTCDELSDEKQSFIQRLQKLEAGFNPAVFCGDWEETAQLLEIAYDNFGINIEPSRNRLFRIANPPAATYGKTAIITTQYEYETNRLWNRTETLIATMTQEHLLEGQLIVEYVIDGMPVAKAVYQVSCKRYAE